MFDYASFIHRLLLEMPYIHLSVTPKMIKHESCVLLKSVTLQFELITIVFSMVLLQVCSHCLCSHIWGLQWPKFQRDELLVGWLSFDFIGLWVSLDRLSRARRSRVSNRRFSQSTRFTKRNGNAVTEAPVIRTFMFSSVVGRRWRKVQTLSVLDCGGGFCIPDAQSLRDWIPRQET